MLQCLSFKLWRRYVLIFIALLRNLTPYVQELSFWQHYYAFTALTLQKPPPETPSLLLVDAPRTVSTIP